MTEQEQQELEILRLEVLALMKERGMGDAASNPSGYNQCFEILMERRPRESPANRYYVAGAMAYAVEHPPRWDGDGFKIRHVKDKQYEAQINGVWKQIIVADFID